MESQEASAPPSGNSIARNVLRGFMAGCIGGFVGGLVKFVCELIAPPRTPDREPPPAVLVEHLQGHALSDEGKVIVSQAVHWGLSTVTGGVYGALVEGLPLAGRGRGTAFGLGFWVVAHELVLPALRLTPALAQLPVSEQVNECVTHVFYGIATDTARQMVRPILT